MSGIPIAITTNSPAAVVNQVNKNGSLNARLSSRAIIHIMKVKTKVLIAIRHQMFFTNRHKRIVINNDNNECPTPKIRSNAFIGENNRFVKNTPNTIP